MIDELFPYPVSHEMKWNGMDTLHCSECGREKKFLRGGGLITINEGDADAPHYCLTDGLDVTAEML